MKKTIIQNRTRAFSLLELVVVLVILIATAVLVMPFISTDVEVVSGEKHSANAIATQTTLRIVQDAIAGDEGVLENLSHEPNVLPRSIEELVEQEPPQKIYEESPELSHYDPVFRIGWRGPYLFPTGKTNDGRPTVVDGWGRELQIQVDFDEDGTITQTESQFIRIVSAGENGLIETPLGEENMKPGTDESQELTLEECGDDLVMFVQVPDLRQ